MKYRYYNIIKLLLVTKMDNIVKEIIDNKIKNDQLKISNCEKLSNKFVEIMQNPSSELSQEVLMKLKNPTSNYEAIINPENVSSDMYNLLMELNKCSIYDSLDKLNDTSKYLYYFRRLNPNVNPTFEYPGFGVRLKSRYY